MKAKIIVVGQPQSRSIIANALRGGNDVERKEYGTWGKVDTPGGAVK